MPSAKPVFSTDGLSTLYGYFDVVASQDQEEHVLPQFMGEARSIFGGLAGKISRIPECDVFALNGGISTVFASGDKQVRVYCGPNPYIYWAEADRSGIKYSDLINAPDSEKLAERLLWLES